MMGQRPFKRDGGEHRKRGGGEGVRWGLGRGPT
jgi:hypothetical protein